MAVYTPLSDAEIRAHLLHYDIGELVEARGITEGVENTNYFLITNHKSRITNYILTLFEARTRAEDLPYFMGLMAHFSARGIATPAPIPMNNGEVIGQLAGKSAVIISFMEGAGVKAPALSHMPALGDVLARMHLAAVDFPGARANALSISGWKALAGEIIPYAEKISSGLGDVMAREVEHLHAHWPQNLPTGAVHADIFPDNVFFVGDTLTGVIDFYFACNDAFAYDLAITINAWCFDGAHHFQPAFFEALMQAYEACRPLNPQEKQALPILCRGAALRFLLTRSYDWLNTPPGANVVKKDPLEYLAKLKFFQSWGGV